MYRRWTIRRPTVHAWLLVAGCTGAIQDGATTDPARTPESGAEPVSTVGPAPSPAACLQTLAPPPFAARRLNRRELANSLRDLLLLSPERDPVAALDRDDTSGGFTNLPDVLTIDEKFVSQFASALLADVDLAVGATPGAAQLLACAAQADETRCAQEILGRFATRAFRRTVAPLELAPFADAFARARKQGSSFTEAMADALATVLASPYFLYKLELAPGGALAGAALASRLSYFLWSSIPDDELLKAGESGALASPAQIEAQVTRMLASPKADALVAGFASEWLQLAALDSKMVPDALRASMQKETQLFARELLLGSRPLSEIVGADFTYIDRTLAGNYKLPLPASGVFQRTSLGGTVRTGGFLTQGSFLAMTSEADSSPTKRGVFVLSSLLCSSPPPPPPGAAAQGGKHDDMASKRENVLRHSADPVCHSCHALMDPIGLGLENFDRLGAYRELEGGTKGARIDPSGQMGDGATFANHTELVALIARDPRLRPCVAEKVLTYGLARAVRQEERCFIAHLSRDSSRMTLPELAADIAGSPLFRSGAAPR